MELIREIEEDIKITEAKKTLKYLNEFRNQDREFFIVLGLDTKNKVLFREVTNIGTLKECPIHPREVFKGAIMKSADKIIVAHNHPSGSLEFSNADLITADKLKEAGELLGIKLLDFILLTKNNFEVYKG